MEQQRNNGPIRIASIVAGASALLTVVCWMFASLQTFLLAIGLVLSVVAGLVTYLILRKVSPDFQSDTLELLFQLAKDEKVDQAQKRISKALYAASRRKDAVFQNLLDTRLATLTDDLRQLGKGRIEFANTESWRVFYEQLLRAPSTTTYHSVAHIETQHYWQDGADSKGAEFSRSDLKRISLTPTGCERSKRGISFTSK